MKKILTILSWVIVISGTFFLMGFSSSERKEMKCNKVEIEIDFSGGNRFIEKEDIEKILNENFNGLKGQSIHLIRTDAVESALNNHPSVENAEVYEEVSGEIRITVRQRTPVIRIINIKNESYYIDNRAFLMPLSPRHAAYVPIVSGYITEGYGKYYGNQMMKGLTPDTILHSTLLDELFAIGDYISKDEFLRAEVEQIYVNSKLEAEIIPRVGDLTIYFGPLKDKEEKFSKLKAFYKKSIANGMINKYSIVNLQFNNQVVCTKKN